MVIPMTECDAIIKANNEIDELKKENKKLNGLCVNYGFEMGRLAEENKQLKDKLSEYEKENENLNNVLEDFMVMLNRLQANPNDEILQSMSKDMLRMMGKDIIGDSE